MAVDATSMWIGFLGLGITTLTVGIALAGLLVTLMVQQEKRSTERTDRLERHTMERIDRLENQFAEFRAEQSRQFAEFRAEQSRQFDQFRAEISQQLAGMDNRIRGLEQGQAHLSGEFSALKDFFTHRREAE